MDVSTTKRERNYFYPLETFREGLYETYSERFVNVYIVHTLKSDTLLTL